MGRFQSRRVMAVGADSASGSELATVWTRP